MNIFSFRTIYLVLTLFGLVVISGCDPTKPVDPLQKGLIAHFAFENNVKDSSGNNYHATAKGNPVYKKGVVDQAIFLDGKDDWLKLAERSHLLNGDFTISTWVRYGPQINGWGYAALFIQSTEKNNPWDGVSIFVSSIVMARLDHTNELNSKANNLSDSDAWHYLSLVKEGDKLSLYIDGKLDKSITATHKKIVKPSPIFIGVNHFLFVHNNGLTPITTRVELSNINSRIRLARIGIYIRICIFS